MNAQVETIGFEALLRRVHELFKTSYADLLLQKTIVAYCIDNGQEYSYVLEDRCGEFTLNCVYEKDMHNPCILIVPDETEEYEMNHVLLLSKYGYNVTFSFDKGIFYYIITLQSLSAHMQV